jgi:hypothetical protein
MRGRAAEIPSMNSIAMPAEFHGYAFTEEGRSPNGAKLALLLPHRLSMPLFFDLLQITTRIRISRLDTGDYGHEAA